MDMGIYTDARLSEPEGDHEVCGFPSHSLEGQKFLDIVRNFTTETFDNIPADLADGDCFVSVKSGGINRFFDDSLRQADHFIGGIGKLEQTCAGNSSDFIFCTEADQAGDQNAVGILLMSFGNLSDRCRPDLLPMSTQDTEN